MGESMHTTRSEFASCVRSWREYRKLSQLDLALTAEVSQRHISWLETGRSSPSREMVIRLSEAMGVPLRERNDLLLAAGYAAVYTENDLADPGMEPILDALKQVIHHHENYPAVVVDRFWNVKMKNSMADVLFDLMGDVDEIWREIADTGDKNLALLTLHPKGLRPYIKNWDQIAPAFVRRLQREASTSGDRELNKHVERLVEIAGVSHFGNDPSAALLPVLPFEIDLGSITICLFSVISTFGTPQDITTDELRVECFYPNDEKTRFFFENLMEQRKQINASSVVPS